MKRVFVVITFFCLLGVNAIAAQGKGEVKTHLHDEAKQIVEQLNLEDTKVQLVYNVLHHVNTRMEDLALGTPNYDRLLGYIDEERSEMMKVILPVKKYEEYNKLYSSVEADKIKKLKSINDDYVNSSSKADREQAESVALMQKDRLLAEK